MTSSQTFGALSAPSIPPEALQASRIAARINCSAAVAGVLAGLAFGAIRRDDDAVLWAVTMNRTAAAGAVRQ